MQTVRIPVERHQETVQGYLVPFSQPGGLSLPIGDFMTIGRSNSCEVQINDQFASSKHARIEKKTGGYVLRDLRSRNGTFLNGSQITEAVLSAGDRMRFGETVYVFSEAISEQPTLTSKSKPWQEQIDRIPAFATTEFPVLITGPSGSGKEILARLVHQKSNRSGGPFVSINCSALSENLIESELFGHTRGSFTGAMNDRKGAFETARGGTLFLDEIGDLPMSLQPKILRALENNEIRPVGSDRTVDTDVRIIAATHKNLAILAQTRQFREDLFYRLNVCQLRPPALTERIEDFDDLVYQFAKQFRVRFAFNSVEKLKSYTWPGNIRELKNLVARVSAYYPGKYIQPEDLDAVIDTSNERTAVAPLSDISSSYDVKSQPGKVGGSVLKEIEREMIIRRLVANQGNQRQTANDLGIPKSTLHDRIKSYSIDLKTLILPSP